MTLDQIKVDENAEDAGLTTGGMGKFAVLAGLAINLASVIPHPPAIQRSDLMEAELLAQVWGDCVDE